jgi:PKD repeat protein
VQSATRATWTASSGYLATNAAAVKFDFTTPAGENGYEGYSEIDLYGVNITSQYTATPTNGLAPLAVQFNGPAVDTGGNAITSWNWNCGDGATSTNQNPSHIYNAAGNYSPSLVVTNNLGYMVMGLGPSISAQFNSGLVANGSFETGDFTGWTLFGGDPGDNVVSDGAGSGISPHSGNYLAVLGSYGSLSCLSQTLTTTAGARYLLSLWLDSPDGLTPNEFLVSWNGNTLFDETDLPALGWTNLQFSVWATGTSTVLEFGFRDDPSYLGLDDISVVALPNNPANITVQVADNNLTLSWPSDHIGWQLQMQVNPSGVGLGTNWVDVANSSTTNQITTPIDPTVGNVFYRMVYP